MHELILHQYPQSHFAEKIKRILAYKGLAWRAVEQPWIMPKPDLVPLTGGFRRIPVLQIGADVYIDTVLIARVIEALHPTPACIPAAHAGLIGVIEGWAGRQFMFQVLKPTFATLLEHLPPAFLEDRAAMSPNLGREAIMAGAADALVQTDLVLDQLDIQLRAQAFLLGADFTLADACVYFPLWLFKNAPTLFEHITARPAVAAWFARIEALGGDTVRPMAPSEALEIARAARPAEPPAGLQRAGELETGAEVAVMADDYGTETCRGKLVHLAADRVTLWRHDPELGEVAVHFPRAGYRITRV
ncbi:MAG: glutathione S-transferase family protein [Gammaproteobacteria bacterium]